MKTKNHIYKPKKGWVISAAVLILAAAAIIMGIQFHKRKNNVEASTQKTTTVPLQKMNLTESISATGSLESVSSATVTAGLNNIPVQKILVSVGDTVKKGDSLIRFDQSDLKTALQEAQDNLSDAKTNADREVSNASSQLTNAQETYRADQKKLTDEVSAAKADLTTAKKTVNQLEKQLKKAQNEQKSTLEQQLTEAQKKKKQAENAYNTALSNQSSSNRQNKSSIDNAKASLETAKSNRTKNVREAQKQVDEVQDNLNACAITAPIDGMITSLGVSQGDTYNGGTIAVIEDTSSFKVTTSVDEYDISKVQVGQKAIIMTEATDQEEFEGQISFIAPTTSSSSSANSSSAETPSTSDSTSDGYDVQISLNPTEEERLKLGMTAKCSIILDEAVDVLAVPYDAVKGRGDRKYISILEEENGEEKQISVTTGMETDYYIEVQGGELEEGMKVVIPSDQTTASDPNSDSEQNSMNGFGFLGNGQSGNPDKNGRPSNGGNPGSGDHSNGGKPGAAPGGN